MPMSNSESRKRQAVDLGQPPQNFRSGGMVGKMVDPYHRVTEFDGYTISLCGCTGGPHLGARKMGTPCRCEKCGYMTREQYEAIITATLARVAALADDLERGSSLMWSSTVAKAIREALDGGA